VAHHDPRPEVRTDGAELERLLAERGSQLVRAATALAGSRDEAEDLGLSARRSAS